jgi:hypothetical protein
MVTNRNRKTKTKTRIRKTRKNRIRKGGAPNLTYKEIESEIKGRLVVWYCFV